MGSIRLSHCRRGKLARPSYCVEQLYVHLDKSVTAINLGVLRVSEFRRAPLGCGNSGDGEAAQGEISRGNVCLPMGDRHKQVKIRE